MKRMFNLVLVLIVGYLVLFPTHVYTQTKQELLAVHQQMKKALNEHDVDGIMAVWADDCEYDYAALPQPLVGKEQIRNFFKDLFTGFPDFHVEQRKILVNNSLIMTECTTTGTLQGQWMGMPPTGKGGDSPHIHMDIYEFEGTKIKKITTYIDISTLMMITGLMPKTELPQLEPTFSLLSPQPSSLPYMELADQMSEIWNSHNLVDYAKYIASDADILIASLGTPINRSQFMASQEMHMAGFPDLVLQIIRKLDMGDGWVIHEELYSGTHQQAYMGIPPTGKKINVRGVVIYHFEDGLSTYQHMYWDYITVLTQLGVFPPDSGSKNWDKFN